MSSLIMNSDNMNICLLQTYLIPTSSRILNINKVQSTPVISKSKGPGYSFDITVFSL